MKNEIITYRKYIGRSYESYPCFDLVKEFYKDQFNLDLSNYFEGKFLSRKESESLIVSNKGDFIPVTGDPQFGDIVVIRFYGIESHVGVCLNASHFLHSARGIGSLMDRLERYSKMIAGFYRHRERQ